MPLIDSTRRSIALKFVYYGPAGVGKTASLKLLDRRLRDGQLKAGGRSGGLLCLDTAGERTVFFETLCLQTAVALGANRTQLLLRLYTVPGDDMHRFTRRLLLRGADGVVLVGDAATPKERFEPSDWSGAAGSLSELRSHLRQWGIDPEHLPISQQRSPCGSTADRDVVESLLALLAASWPAVEQSAAAAKLSDRPNLPRYIAALRQLLGMSQAGRSASASGPRIRLPAASTHFHHAAHMIPRAAS